MNAYDNLRRLVDELGVNTDARPAALPLPPAVPNIPHGHTSWLVTLDRAGRCMTVPWYQHGPGGAYDPPAAHAVLLALMGDVDSFHAAGSSRERWALAHGFDDDDRGAWQAYGELARMASELEHILAGDYGAIQRAVRLARREIEASCATGAVVAESVRQYA